MALMMPIALLGAAFSLAWLFSASWVAYDQVLLGLGSPMVVA
jgi:hypothetical protein